MTAARKTTRRKAAASKSTVYDGSRLIGEIRPSARGFTARLAGGAFGDHKTFGANVTIETIIARLDEPAAILWNLVSAAALGAAAVVPNLQANIAAINRIEIAKRAETEAAFIAKTYAARGARDAVAKALEEHRAKLASLEGQAESLPDDDKGLREHFLAIEVSKGRINIGERKLELADIAVAEAEADQKADRDGNGAAFHLAVGERERFIDEFDRQFPERARALFELIRSAVHFEALARAEVASAPATLPEFNRSDAGFAQMRIELVTKDGTIVWRSDQFAGSAWDPDGDDAR